MGIDDIFLQKVKRTVVIDLETQRPIEVLACQEKEEVTAYLNQLTHKNAIRIVCMDMAAHFVVSVQEAFSDPAQNKPLIVFDKWHVIRQSLDAMNEARKQCQRHIRAVAGRDKRKNVSADIDIKNLKKHYSLFLRRSFHEFRSGLDATRDNYFDRWPSLKAAFDLKEKFCDIWAAKNRIDAAERMDSWVKAHDKDIELYKKGLSNALRKYKATNRRKPFVHADADPALTFAGARSSITRNREFVLNYFDPRNIGADGRRYTNAGTEASNGLIKFINRTGRGYKFKTLRAKVLLREPYLPIIRKAQQVKREKTGKRIKSPFESSAGPVSISHVFLVDGENMTVCASATCKTKLKLPKTLVPLDHDNYEVPHNFRFCEPCYQARVDHANLDHEEVFRYVEQTKLFLE